MAPRINLLCEELYTLYFEKQLTFAEIARQFGCSPVTVHKRLKACGFQARPSGGVWVSKPLARRGVGIRVHLNRSFDFLLPHDDTIDEWILSNDNLFAAFWAGYVDAEGSFIVSRGRAYFKVDSGDKGILYQAWTRLGDMGIVFPEPKLIRPAGTWIKQFQLASHRDLWHLATERKETLIRLCTMLSPYLRHSKRIQAMKAVKANVASRTPN